MSVSILTSTVVCYVCNVHPLPQLWLCVVTSRNRFVYTSLYSKCKLTHWDSVSFYVASMSWSIFVRLIFYGFVGIFDLGESLENQANINLGLLPKAFRQISAWLYFPHPLPPKCQWCLLQLFFSLSPTTKDKATINSGFCKQNLWSLFLNYHILDLIA